MTYRIFDFGHLSPAERIELAAQLWDSLDEAAVQPSHDALAELRRRRAELARDGDPGELWTDVLNSLENRRR